ncbi:MULTISPECIES: ABC transporter ATP-binding protein [Streptomyces]|uniref:Putative ABC transporter ATP-binding subunit n=11 Tax=Streptomyces scabiei TaxID=1930 RepID=C9ZCY3_STRSW|nr:MULTISPECIES: ABC transporter ATP-binding protein [Streptomyces]MBP5872956.1 ABC transporter ATP-binding protein [Streptomyces sp. LBUM 1485]MBP5934288.1 ABC transporter ATP-binding protein [Streptomyces sp. LBUM 1479]KFG09890.1 ABC transporter [Streptomyces scabiei]MBP5888540.1 ABC transporter ATP-binding protein [Streptomyces sp. LBUM 1487]MBP5904564.1 ABC transporter ATP-binding protein [Streptomyces sp. LBUM 1488]
MISLLLRVLGDEHAGPLRRTLSLMTVAAVAEGLAYALLVPILRALFGSEPQHAWGWLGAFAAAASVCALLRYRADVSGFRAGAALSRGLHHRLGDHLARLPLGWFTPRRVGDVTVLASRSVLQVMAVPAHRLQPLISAGVLPLTVVIVMLCYDWRLGVAAVVAKPVVAAALIWTGRATAAHDAERARRGDEAAGRVVEYLRAQPVLRVGGRTSERFRLLDDALDGQRRAVRRSALSALPGVLGLSFTVQAVFTALLVLGTWLALGGRIEPAEVLALLVLAARCVDPLLSLSDLSGQMRASRGELERLDTVLREPPLAEPGKPVEPRGSGLVLDSVVLRRGGRTVLDGVSLTVPEGKRVAVVGPSGAGKSTLLQLLARFHDVDAGAVRLGGVDVRDIGTEDLMSRVSVVFQDVYLFDGTIEENVRLGRPDADEADVLAAAEAARLDEVVARLPDGWATRVGEGGAVLSGGERQRVSIARAMLKDAPVVLLDEATSGLDPENEQAVQDGLDRLLAGRTVVVVAHRLRTVRETDLIAFLDGGRIVEQGTHEELLRRGGRYAQFWQVSLTPVPSE